MTFRFTGFADEAGKSLAEQIDVVREVGWNSIELRSIDGRNVCDFDDDAWAEVWNRLQEAGITVAAFGGQIANWARPITSDFAVDLAELERVAPRMKQAGTNILRVMSYPNAPDAPWPRAKWREEVIRRLRALAAAAEERGVILAHENCSGYGGLGPEEFLDLAQAVDSPAFKLCFDTGNSAGHAGNLEASWRYYEACRDFIVHVHIKAYKRGEDGKLHTCFPDEDPNQARILADLKRRGYSGWISIEPHIAAAIHAGKEVDDSGRARRIWVEYARRLERLAAGL